jgi:hypothetical protein
MPDGRSLYDLFGFEWTLLAFKPAQVPAQANLKILQLENSEARDLYGADFVLIRPDQIVAWRGNSAAQANVVLRQICGVFPGAQGAAALT